MCMCLCGGLTPEQGEISKSCKMGHVMATGWVICLFVCWQWKLYLFDYLIHGLPTPLHHIIYQAHDA